MTRIVVIYYSSNGANHTIAEAFVAGATEAGAEIRLRRAAELAPLEVIERNPAEPVEELPITDRDEDFVRYVLNEVEGRERNGTCRCAPSTDRPPTSTS